MAQETLHPGTPVYDMEYFSSSQANIYIGDVLVDEVTSMQWTVQQNKTPLYGYASQLWDDCAEGQVIVEGAFTINFKEAGYLWAVLRRYKQISMATALRSSEGKKGLDRFDRALGIKGQYVDRRPVWGSNATRTQRESIERIMQGKATKGEENEFYHDLVGYATHDVKSPQDKVFEDMVEVFEDQIWSSAIANNDLNSQIRRTDHNAFDDFDIYATYGNYSVPGVNHTVIKLLGVHLTSRGQQIQVGGDVIQELYQFRARSMA